MSRKITIKQRRFADEYVQTGNGRQSALAVYDTDSPETAAVIASENLTKPNVIEYIQGQAAFASLRIRELAAQDEHLPTALNAAKDILDRAGVKPLEVTMNISGTVDDLKDAVLKDMQRFQGPTKP